MDPFDVAAGTTALVGVASLLIAAGAWRAMVRTGNRSIGFVVFGFALLAVKSLLKALNLAYGSGETATTELGFSLLDIGAIGAIAWPLLLPLRRGGTP